MRAICMPLLDVEVPACLYRIDRSHCSISIIHQSQASGAGSIGAGQAALHGSSAIAEASIKMTVQSSNQYRPVVTVIKL